MDGKPFYSWCTRTFAQLLAAEQITQQQQQWWPARHLSAERLACQLILSTSALGDTNHYLHPCLIDKNPEAFEDDHGGLPKRSWANKVSWWFWPLLGGVVGAGGRGGGCWFNREAALPLAGGLGWPCLGWGWPAPHSPSGFLDALPCSLFFSLTSCFLFLIVLPDYCHLLPSSPAQPGCAGGRLIFKSKGKRAGR